MARHKHADLIHAWAEGETIQFCSWEEPYENAWLDCKGTPTWDSEILHYRIKPKEPEWWENIPEYGVLCWWEGTVVTVVGKNNKYKRKGTNGSIFWIDGDVVPLTNEEIERFKR